MNELKDKIGSPVNVQAFIDAHPFSRYQWLVLLLCFLIVAVDGFDVAAVGFVVPSITKEWGVSNLALAPALSAALFGSVLGALGAGPLADQIGRKRVLVGSVLLFGLLTAATAYAESITSLTILRFLTGLGLGAAMPNATTLLSEYAPAKRRSLLVNVMFCGFTLGSAAGGLFAAQVVPEHGWRSVFLAGGIMPILMVPVLMLALPESLSFMAFKKWPQARIKRILARIADISAIQESHFYVPEKREDTRGGPVAEILSSKYRIGTVMLWTTYFMGLLVYYLATSWMPTWFKSAGLPLRQAALITALFPLGGILGAVICGWLMDRFNAHKVVAATYTLTGIFMWCIGQFLSDVTLLSVFTFIAGICMTGAQISMPSIAASFYPTHCRASGVAWMLGIGRIGGILAAFVGGALMQAGFGAGTILSMMILPPIVAATALIVKNSLPRRAVHLREVELRPQESQ
jgi:AAHS family 4-hydroxybenzoate transporter-like MFS transporter